jgi:hypothetical protein
MVALCLSIFHTLRFTKIKQLFLSPFIFTQMEKDVVSENIAGKLEMNKQLLQLSVTIMS